MEPINLQTLVDALQNLEQRVNSLQTENEGLRQQQQQQMQHCAAPVVDNKRSDDFFRIPDPIKNIPSFEGSKKQLASWLTTVRKTLRLYQSLVSAEVLALYEQAIINKIDGRARDTICVNGNPTTFEEVADILESVYGDKADIATYQTQLWSLKMNDNLHLHYKRCKEILQNMKSLAKRNEIYMKHWEGINHFLEKECLAAFINGLNKHYFGHAQAAQPVNIETTYAFLCKFQNAENNRKTTENPYPSKSNFKNNVEKYKPNFSKNPENYKNPEGSQKFRSNSDRFKATPMEVDPSLRSRQNKIFNTETKEQDDLIETDSDESDVEEEEQNFQLGIPDNNLK